MKFLFVEDNRVTRLSVSRILKKDFPTIEIVEAENGQKAFDYLKQCAREDLPYFILLDLNMPIMDGIEFLALLRQDERFTTLPVVIFTTSSNLDDYYKCENSSISGYFIKNVDFKKFQETLIIIGQYWLNSFNDKT